MRGERLAVMGTLPLEASALSQRQPGHNKVTVGSCQPVSYTSCILVCEPVFELLVFTSFKEQQGEKPRGQREGACVGYPSQFESAASSLIRKPNHSFVQICTGEECLPVIYQPWIFTGASELKLKVFPHHGRSPRYYMTFVSSAQ